MATSTIAAVEDYLRTNYDPDMKYVGGQLVERNVGGWRHRRLQGLIAALLCGREQDRFLTFTEQRVRVSSKLASYRIPMCAW